MAASHASRLAPVGAVKAKTGKLPLKFRLQRLRKGKLRLESQHEKDKEEKQELKAVLRDRDAYIRQLEMLLERHQHQIDKCTMRMGKAGVVPIVKCFDCGKPYPTTQFQHRVSSNGNASKWVIDGQCKKCRYERWKKWNAKKREVKSAPHMDDDQQIKQMACELAGRITDKMIDEVVDGRSSNRGGRVVRHHHVEDDPTFAERY